MRAYLFLFMLVTSILASSTCDGPSSKTMQCYNKPISLVAPCSEYVYENQPEYCPTVEIDIIDISWRYCIPYLPKPVTCTFKYSQDSCTVFNSTEDVNLYLTITDFPTYYYDIGYYMSLRWSMDPDDCVGSDDSSEVDQFICMTPNNGIETNFYENDVYTVLQIQINPTNVGNYTLVSSSPCG